AETRISSPRLSVSPGWKSTTYGGPPRGSSDASISNRSNCGPRGWNQPATSARSLETPNRPHASRPSPTTSNGSDFGSRVDDVAEDDVTERDGFVWPEAGRWEDSEV